MFATFRFLAVRRRAACLLTLVCLWMAPAPASAAEPASLVAGRTADQWQRSYEQGDEFERLLAIRAAASFGAAARHILRAGLDDPAAAVRAWATTAVARDDELRTTPDVASRLSALLADRSASVRLAAAFAVLKSDPSHAAARGVLEQGLTAPGRGAPVVAADFLSELRLTAALPALQGVADHNDYHVQNAAQRAIARIGAP